MRAAASLLVCAAGCAEKQSPPLPRYLDQEYRLGREDVIEVLVQGDPALSREVPIRPDGRISLPLVGELEIAGLTAREAAALVASKLAAWLRDPRVTVVVREVNAARFFVLGEVHRPGAFPLRSKITVLSALASAGGLTEWAHQSAIVLLRSRSDGTVERVVFDLRDAVGGKEEATILLGPGDILYVP